jgi:hypothetical protein
MGALFVVPARAGTQKFLAQSHEGTKGSAPFFVASWLCAKQIVIPASAGMTVGGVR